MALLARPHVITPMPLKRYALYFFRLAECFLHPQDSRLEWKAPNPFTSTQNSSGTCLLYPGALGSKGLSLAHEELKLNSADVHGSLLLQIFFK